MIQIPMIASGTEVSTTTGKGITTIQLTIRGSEIIMEAVEDMVVEATILCMFRREDTTTYRIPVSGGCKSSNKNQRIYIFRKFGMIES